MRDVKKFPKQIGQDLVFYIQGGEGGGGRGVGPPGFLVTKEGELVTGTKLDNPGREQGPLGRSLTGPRTPTLRSTQGSSLSRQEGFGHADLEL